MEVSSSLPLTQGAQHCPLLFPQEVCWSSERERAGLKVSFIHTGKDQEEGELALW